MVLSRKSSQVWVKDMEELQVYLYVTQIQSQVVARVESTHESLCYCMR